MLRETPAAAESTVDGALGQESASAGSRRSSARVLICSGTECGSPPAEEKKLSLNPKLRAAEAA
jgi:hypothetical protein